MGSQHKADMRRTATIAVIAYALAILVAGLGPHCDWMFPSAEAAPVASAHAAHGGNHAAPAPLNEPPAQDCASMEMSKSAGPLPAALIVATPDITAHAAVLPDEPISAGPSPAKILQARGPPRSRGGFAAVFATNHRLLI